MRRFFALAAAYLSLLACDVDIWEPSLEPGDNTKVKVRFSPHMSRMTKGCVSPSETQINDLNIYAFRNGMLEDCVYVTSVDDAVLSLSPGYMYDIFALANMGEKAPDYQESDFIEAIAYGISDISQIEDGIPMCCACRNLNVGKATRLVELQMERLAAKIVLSLDKNSLLEGFHVKSVRLRQCASLVHPFKWYGKGGSRMESSNEAIDGDYAIQYDLDRLNSGQEVVFYTLENSQGILLPSNTDPLLKTPENLGDVKARCTYLEICGSFGTEGIFDGDVNYRIYLGLDSTSSFDIPGNACIRVSLMLTDKGFHEVSWKVDADVSVRDGYARGYISKGMHPMNDLYVGEKFLYEVEFASELLDYIGGDVSGCTLSLVDDSGMSNGGGIYITDLTGNGNTLQAELLCTEPLSGQLYLHGRDGECLGCLENDVQIKAPRFIVSEYSEWPDTDPVEPFDYIQECEINGTPAIFYLYLVDSDGCNLNCTSGHGVDPDQFYFSFVGTDTEYGDISASRVYYEILSPSESGNAMAKISFYLDNSGRNHNASLMLAEAYTMGSIVWIDMFEESYEIPVRLSVTVAIPQVRLSLVDNGWAKYHDCQLSVIVDNPSNLPLEVSAWQLIASNINYGPVDESYVETNLVREKIDYITGKFYNGTPAVYGSSSAFVCERNSYGSAALESEDCLVYPLTGISTDDLLRALNYDKLGNNQMIHSFDVSCNGRKLRPGDLVLEDSVSDGSQTYDYIYYSQESWNYRGAELYSSGEFISYSGSWGHDYPNLCASSLDRMYDRFSASQSIDLTFGYDSDSKKITLLSNYDGASDPDMTFSALYEGVTKGYVKTYPKGTWYSSQDNNCSVNINHQATGIRLESGSAPVWADDGKIYGSLNDIYAFSYLDSPKPLGADSYMHRAHPVNMNLNVSVLTEGNEKYELYPVTSIWKPTQIDYYHQQEGTNYKCTVNADIEEFTMVVVSHR